MLSVAPVNNDDKITLEDDGTLTGKAHAVPYGREVAQIAVLAEKVNGQVVALVNRDDCIIQQHNNHAEEPRDTIELDGVAPIEVTDTVFTQDH